MPLEQPSAFELRAIRAAADFTGRRVLEVGAGDGRLAWPFAREAALWFALDPCAEDVLSAGQALRLQPIPSVRLAVGDGRWLGLPAESFDVVFFTWSLCWIPRGEMSSAVAEARRVRRIQVNEMSNLISSIVQADLLGVSVSKVLRVQADQLRILRRQRAEELAHQASIKMLFPLVFLIFPAMLAVWLGPAIPLIMETFGGL